MEANSVAPDNQDGKEEGRRLTFNIYTHASPCISEKAGSESGSGNETTSGEVRQHCGAQLKKTTQEKNALLPGTLRREAWCSVMLATRMVQT